MRSSGKCIWAQNNAVGGRRKAAGGVKGLREWRPPGSTLFLVWQQQRGAEERLGDLNLSRDFRGLGRIRPENVLLPKVSYWLNQ